MFDQMKNLKNLAGMLGNSDQMREKVEQLQAELARKTAEAEAGAGAVRVTANGRMQIVSIRFDPPMLAALVGEGDEADREMVEELITSATNAALEKAQELVREEMSKLTGGLNLPGMDQLFGGS